MERKIALKQLKFLKSKKKNMRLAAEGWENDWQTLIAIILSARTRDETTIIICENIFKKYPTPEKFSKLKLSEIELLINKVNFYKNKSKNIFNCTRKIISKFERRVPQDINKLITLPGVGRKTANVFLSEGGGSHIGVDTHVSYISQYLNWTKFSKPEKIEKDLENLFPKTKWGEVNRTLVGFGKTYTSRKQKNELLEEIKSKYTN